MHKLTTLQWVAVAVIALALVAFIVWYKKIKPAKIKPEDLPNSGDGIPEGWSPSNLSDRFYKMINGINWSLQPNGALFREYAELQTNDMFAAVALDYAQRYSSDLFDDINQELAVGLRDDSEYWQKAIMSRAKNMGIW